jgi:hypothetical protein
VSSTCNYAVGELISEDNIIYQSKATKNSFEFEVRRQIIQLITFKYRPSICLMLSVCVSVTGSMIKVRKAIRR